MWFVERKEVTFDVHVNVAWVGMFDMVISLGWDASSPVGGDEIAPRHSARG